MLSGCCYPPVDRTVMDAGCYVTSVGILNHEHGRYPPLGHPTDYRFDWGRGRILPDAALVVISRGSGCWESRHAKGTLEPGCILFLPPLGWHRYRPAADLGWCEKWLCLRGALIHQLIEVGIIPAQAQVLKCDSGSAWESQLDRLREEITRQQGRNLPSWGSRGLSLLLELWEPGNAQPVKPLAPTIAAPGNLLRQAQRFIEENSHRPILVEDVARACGRTRRTLERLFLKARLGSVSDRIAADRMSRARHLLMETDLSVKQVAGDAGFRSSQHMINCFRRLDNCTPTQYRRSKGSD